ncbi:adenosylcobalamin-dependent ribonucleoside-diphosphate reductase, partial [Candidatus Woesearchaeota archaeon]|nr:adenosylcobalamin-dependent ribonucleoside-diphosphate reductase [Candidatus Woesearchaeota archaeon]
MFRRVAKAVSSGPRQYLEFYHMLSSLDFLPNSPTLMNAGTKLGQLSACFVLPIEDSMESIFETLKDMALIFQSGGGCGYSFSSIRPEGDLVKSTKGIASGPVSFMTIFDKATEVIKQGGKRRGANMAVLHYTHPDILKFITIKRDHITLQNFNISVAVDKKFFDSVSKNKSYFLVNPRNNKKTKISARKVFDEIVNSAWLTGDPGLLFIDEINKEHPLKDNVEATNPCGEQPLLPYESCNLGSINLSNFVKNKEIDYERLKTTIRLAVEFLDNVIDINKYPIDEIKRITKDNRKIGLGVMGFADMLVKLGIRYGSTKSIVTAEHLMKFITTEARKKSEELGKRKGDFPNFKRSKLYKKYKHMRNATVTTIAPTGSISLIADVSSGIEPIFAKNYTRVIMGKKTRLKHKLYSKKTKPYFITAHDVKPDQQVKILAAFQKYIDNAVSKTVNLKSTATKEQIANIFKLAYKLNCKGITVYRDKSKKEQILCEVC